MNLFQLLEAVKTADQNTKEELIDRFYRKEKIIVNAMVENERRYHDIER